MKKNVQKSFLSWETRKELDNLTLLNIQTITRLIDNVRESIRVINKSISVLQTRRLRTDNNERKDQIYYLQRYSEYTLLVGLLYLDIATAFRIYLNARENYEVIYSAKQILIIINEGYKKLYHHIFFDKQNNPITKHRNNSFWIKDIGGLVKQELPHLLPTYSQITNDLNIYNDAELKAMKDQRDGFIHYDNNPSKVYDMLTTLDIEVIAVKTLPFLSILNKMFVFSHKLLKEYNQVIETKKNDFLSDHILKLEELKGKNSQADAMLGDLQNWLKDSVSKYSTS